MEALSQGECDQINKINIQNTEKQRKEENDQSEKNKLQFTSNFMMEFETPFEQKLKEQKIIDEEMVK